MTTLAPDIAAAIAMEIAALWPWEAIAVVLAIAYLLLAIRQSVWCWPAGLASTLIYFVLLSRAALYTEAVLQLFYAGLAIYGWLYWARPQTPLPVTRWPLRRHVQALGVVFVLGLANGALLAAFTPAALPYADALVAWASVLTTWMVARKLLENWLWWFVIDSASIVIYAYRGLWLTAALFACYLVLIVHGYAAWRRDLVVRPA